ncbi:S8 family serine peptidase [Micromonospora sp. NPDC049903]|uniref:S8 family serine peptidase n=1 Tax=Micromonospora sp. NPDC049903 TaxID=3364276 RepID=UPI00379BBD4E
MLLVGALTSGLTTQAHPQRSSIDAERIRHDQWHIPYLKVTEAHQSSQGDGVVVAILDTGVSPHPDLRSNLLPGADLTTERPSTGQKDNSGHGTGMAGIVAAHGQSAGAGALGVAPRAKILPVRCFDGQLASEVDRLASAIEYAITAGADVISISAGGGSNPKLMRSLEAAQAAGVIVVAAAGDRPQDFTIPYPAAADGVIAVGGVDRKGEITSTSTHGRAVDLVAPAVDIYSTSINEKYRKGTGTSNATAIVAGAAALIRAKYPYLPADEVAHRLTATAIDKGPPGRDDQYGYGVIDLVAALTADVPPRGFGPGGSATPSPGTTRAAGPEADEDSAAVRGMVTLAVLIAAGAGGVWWARRRRRSDDPPPRVSR